MQKFQVREVFTPTSPARIAFVDREAINSKLVYALQTPGKQIIVYGNSGSGKTTLLANKLTQLYERHITTRCMKGLKFEQLILDAFDQLAPFFTSERTAAKKHSTSIDLTGSYLAIQSKINSTVTTEASQKEVRMLPPQLTPQALGKFLGDAKCCWVLEDFHKIDETEKIKLSQLMKVFTDLADDYPDLKIVALGAVDTARKVVDYDREMRNRVAEIQVSLMTESEIENVISKGEEALNVSFDGDIKTLIARYSNGLASVCHHLCLYMCDAASITETCSSRFEFSVTNLENALRLYVEEASDSIKSTFDCALRQRRKTKFDNGRLILEALSTFKEGGASRIDLLKKICRKEPKYPETNLKYMLPKLQTEEYGSIVRFDQTSGMYSFSDPIYRVFALAQFRNRDDHQHVKFIESDWSKFVALLKSEMTKQLPAGSAIRFEIKGIKAG